MTTETENPAKIINNQTFRDNGSKNANRLTDFSGAFTNKILIPRSRNGIEKSTTYKSIGNKNRPVTKVVNGESLSGWEAEDQFGLISENDQVMVTTDFFIVKATSV